MVSENLLFHLPFNFNFPAVHVRIYTVTVRRLLVLQKFRRKATQKATGAASKELSIQHQL
jgi:hypothetical protein